jgi:PmbA protein
MIKEKYIQKVKEVSISISQTEIESIRQKNIEKTGLRVYDNGYLGYAGTIGDYDEKELAAKAIKALDNKIPYIFEPNGNPSIKEDYSLDIIPEEIIVDEIDELLTLIKRDQPEFYFSNKIKLAEHELKLMNDKGLNLGYRDKYMSFELIFKEKNSANIMDGAVEFKGRKYNRHQVLAIVNEICSAYKNKVDLPYEGRLPVIFSTEDSLPLIKFLTDLDGNKFGSGSSLFSNKIGRKIFSKNFTLYQSNNPEDQPGAFFDTEGTVNKNYRFALIENGVLKAPYTDKKSSYKFNLPLTGAATGDYDSAPALGFPNLLIKSSEKTARELLNGEMGIFVVIASGGDFTPDGNFATPVQLALLFDGERFIGRLPELNITSSVFDMFGDSFIGVSSNSLSPLSNGKFLIMMMKVNK